MAITEQDLAPGLAAKVAQMGIFLSPNANVIYVDSGHASAGTGKPGSNPRNPLSTIDAAFTAADTAVTASNGDLIIVMPGHTESIADATSLAPDVVGVTILGLGRGSDRPTITFTNASGNIPISAANISMINFLMTISGTIDVTAGITVSAANVLLKDIEMREAAIDDQFVDAIVGATCARLHVDGYKFVGATASDQATQSALSITDTSAEIQITNFNLLGSFAAAGLDITGAATDLYIADGRIEQRHTSMDATITVSGTATGFLQHVYVRTATDDATGMTAALTATNNLQIFDFRVVNADGEIGVDGPTSDLDQTDNDGATGTWGIFSTLET